MPYINISIFEGHPQERKARIAKRITEVIHEETRVPEDMVWVTFTDIPKHDWSVGGELCGEKA